eukprot:39841-Eustigmatos_ZCMA.PRE.1
MSTWRISCVQCADIRDGGGREGGKSRAWHMCLRASSGPGLTSMNSEKNSMVFKVEFVGRPIAC